MQVRFPKYDLKGLRAHWAPNHEFAQMVNALGVVPAYIEPFLCKVMQRAQAELVKAPGRLKDEVAIFIKQEMQHCRQHLRFNKSLRESGYPGMLPIELRYEADYDRFLKSRSLQLNLAYCEGFEAMSSLGTVNFFEEYDEFYKDAHQETIELWRWHMAEEFEHRTVVHETYHALFGHRPVRAYLYRIWGLMVAARHISRTISQVEDYLLTQDRREMGPIEIEQSKQRLSHARKAAGRRARQCLLPILSPLYDPAKRRTPRGVEECLMRYARPEGVVA